MGGTCLAHRLGAMAPQWRPLLPDFGHRPVKSVTLDLGGLQVATPGQEPRAQYVFRPGQRVLLLEDRADFRQVLHDYLLSRSFQVTSVPSGRGPAQDPEGSIRSCHLRHDDAGGRGARCFTGRWHGRGRQRVRGSFSLAVTRMIQRMNFFFKPVKATVLFKPLRLEELDAAIREVPSQVSLTYEYADMFDGYPRTELAN